MSRTIPHMPYKSTQAAKIVFDSFLFVFKMTQSWVDREKGGYVRSKYDQNTLSKILNKLPKRKNISLKPRRQFNRLGQDCKPRNTKRCYMFENMYKFALIKYTQVKSNLH